MKIAANYRPWYDSVDVFLYLDIEGIGRDVALPLSYQRVKHGDALPKPTLSLSPEEAQQMMDELWRCGLRPSEGSGSAGALAATERHLADMRRLVFDAKEST